MKFAGHALTGFTTVILLLLLIGSLLMISLGLIGLYLARIYDEVKGRPRFVVAEAVGSRQIPPDAGSSPGKPLHSADGERPAGAMANC
jgi:hypothetical protein